MKIVVALSRGSLWLLLIPAGLFAIMSLFTGLTFGFALWNPADPVPTIVWLAVLALPIVIGVNLKAQHQSLASLLISTVGCWAFVIWYLLSLDWR